MPSRRRKEATPNAMKNNPAIPTPMPASVPPTEKKVTESEIRNTPPKKLFFAITISSYAVALNRLARWPRFG